MATRVRPTSRGRARCASFRMGRQSEQTAAGSRAGACRLRRRALSDAALPRRGKGRCKCAGATLFAPAGQKRFRVARLVLVCRGREQKVRVLCPSGTAGRRAGGREISDAGMRATPLQPFCADKIQISVPSARPVSHAIPQGDRRALPAPAQGINPLGIPFWGTGDSSVAPSPKTPQAAGPCSWACRRLLPPPPQPNQNAATPPHS